MKNLPKINPAKAVKASLPYVFAGLLCTKLGEAYRLTTGGDVLDKLLAAFTKLGLVFQNPLPSFHPFDLLVGAVAAVLLRLVVWSKIKNAKKYRHGEEYGTARWGNEKDIAPFINSDFSQNILLTDTERLTLGKIADPEKRNVNLNVLVIGGSGSGKTRYHIKPNLLQMNASYVCSDPKGTVVEEVGRALVQQGHYKLKILNTIDFSCSMHYTFDFIIAIFEMAQTMVQQSAGVIDANASIDISTALASITTELEAKGLGELFALMLETWVVSFAMTVMGALITIILYGRMIEIYIYASVGPLPFATLANHEWGNIGTNYIRGLVALGLQGFLIMVITGIYAILVKSLSISGGDLHGAIWTCVAYTVLLCFSLFKSGSVAKSILNAH